MNKKYKIREDGRIVALRSFGNIFKGDVGGFVASEENLSHEGSCWVSDNAQVYGNAQVSGNAWVHDNAQVYGNAQVSGDAHVFGNARVSGYARVYSNAWVYGKMQVDGKRPYYFIQTSLDSITATPELISIGCELHTPQHWLKHYKKIGKKHNYTEAQIAEYGCLLSLFKEWK